MPKIILSADSTCDLGPELQQKYDIKIFNFHIQLGDNSYLDMLEITPDDIYEAWRVQGILPKTAAVSVYEYYNFFQKWVEEGYEVVHLNLGAGLSSSYQNCCLAAAELGQVYPIDTASLSVGIGLLVLEAAKMRQNGCTAAQIQQDITAMRHKAQVSFILDTMELLQAGGRCSSLVAFSANLLNIKPCIEVKSDKGGLMEPGKKYRGKRNKIWAQYVKDKLCARDDLNLSRAFIVHSGLEQSELEQIKEEVTTYAAFQEIHIARANSTISAHCGPGAMGIMFMTE